MIGSSSSQEPGGKMRAYFCSRCRSASRTWARSTSLAPNCSAKSNDGSIHGATSKRYAQKAAITTAKLWTVRRRRLGITEGRISQDEGRMLVAAAGSCRYKVLRRLIDARARVPQKSTAFWPRNRQCCRLGRLCGRDKLRKQA